MKKIISYVVLFAVAAILSISCQTPEIKPKEPTAAELEKFTQRTAVTEIVNKYFSEQEIKSAVATGKVISWAEIERRSNVTEREIVRKVAASPTARMEEPAAECNGGTCCGWFEYPNICYYCFITGGSGVFVTTKCVNLVN